MVIFVSVDLLTKTIYHIMNDIILVKTSWRLNLDVQTDTGWAISINLVVSLAFGYLYFIYLVFEQLIH